MIMNSILQRRTGHARDTGFTAAPVNGRARVTRAEISALFAEELGYRTHSALRA